MNIARTRLLNQGIADPRFTTPRDVVSWFGAMQAQDYLGALWAVGLRMKSAVEADVERAVAERTIVRSWPLRRTLHFVAAEDLKWMLELLGPRMIARHAARLKQHFEIDAAVLRRCRPLVIQALRDGGQLTRDAFYEILHRARIRTNASRGLHIINSLAHERLICFGPREGKQPTFVLLDEWVSSSTQLAGDEALQELALRYFRSHGPATVADFAWWSGLPIREAKRASEMVDMRPQRMAAATRSAWLLPAFDEYLVAYKDRSAVMNPALSPTIVAGGEVVGTWRRSIKKDVVTITPSLFRSLTKSEERMVRRAEERYAAFLT